MHPTSFTFPLLGETSLAAIGLVVGGAALVAGAIVVAVREHRERRQVQAGQLRLRSDMARVNERAESFRGEKNQILRIATQDLAHPVAQLCAEFEALSTLNPPSPEVAVHVERAAEPLVRIRRSLTALKEIQALEERSQALTLVSVNVGAILLEAVSHAQNGASRKNVRLSLPSPTKTALAIADANVLRKTFENLIGDAIEVTPPGGAVSLSLYQTSDRVLVTVADEGPGAAVNDQAQLLGQSGHSRPPFASEDGGARLNLAMVHNLIKAMDGWLWSQSEPGRGTTHVVELALPGTTKKK